MPLNKETKLNQEGVGNISVFLFENKSNPWLYKIYIVKKKKNKQKTKQQMGNEEWKSKGEHKIQAKDKRRGEI